MRNFASKSSAPDEVDPAESVLSEIKAVRFKIEAVEIDIKTIEIDVEEIKIRVEALRICFRYDETEIANSTNIHVQTYLLSVNRFRIPDEIEDLIEKAKRRRDEKPKLLDKNNKLLDLLILLVQEKNLLRSEGKGNATVAISPSLYDYCFSILCPVEYPYALRQ